MMVQILEILKYILPSIVVLICAYLIINKFLVNDIERKQLAIFDNNSKELIRLRLNAYERLILFMERIHPTGLIARFYSQDNNVQDLQLAMVQSIRAEFEHNVSQQIYVSNEVWQTVNSVKEQEIAMINQIAASLPFGAPAKDFVQRFTQFVLENETAIPSDVAVQIINGEAKKLLLNK